MYVISFPVYVLLTRGLQRPLYERQKLNPGEFTVTFFICTAAMIIGSTISNIINDAIIGSTGFLPDDSLDEAIANAPLWLIIAVVVIIGPIFEELIFRKIMLDRLSVYGDRLAIGISALSFGLFHGNISQLIYSTMLGVILGYLYTRTRNIKYPILMHMLINFFGTVPSLLLMNGIERYIQIMEKFEAGEVLTEAEATFQMLYTLDMLGVTAIQYGFAAIGLILFMVMALKNKITIPRRRMVQVGGWTKFRMTFLNLGFILFLLYTAYAFLISTFPALFTIPV